MTNGGASSGGSASEGEGSLPDTSLHSDSEQGQGQEPQRGGAERGGQDVDGGQSRAQLPDAVSHKGLELVGSGECPAPAPEVDGTAEGSRAEVKPRSQVGLGPEPHACLLSETPEEAGALPSLPAEPEDSANPPTNGFIHGLLEIHTAKPSLEHILPAAEPPLVGVD